MSKTTTKSTKKSKLDNLVNWRFQHVQPTWEQKSAWRERKRNAQKIMDLILQFQTLTKKELEQLAEDSKDTMTILEAQMVQYVLYWSKDKKMLIDMMNRHISYAPAQQEISWKDWWAIEVKSVLDDVIL